MFDTRNPINITLPTADGEKKVTVRYPDTKEWKSRASKIVLIQRNQGKGKTTTDVDGSLEANSQLFDMIFLEGDQLDQYEKSTIIDRLSRCEVVAAEYVGASYVITLDTPLGETIHKIKMPSAKQMHGYKRTITSVTSDRKGNQIISINISTPEAMYDALVESFENYADEVPVIHKSAVMSEVISMVDNLASDKQLQGF